MKLPRINQNVVAHAALAAAFSAGFNSDWFKAQFASLRRDIDTGGMKPFVPYALAGVALFVVLRGR